jgi:hypothetical protein
MSEEAQQDNDTWVKSYTYLRTAMVLLLFGLGVAVFYQTGRQWLFLASVSAYYYTPAQGIFVGALVGLGVCMVALRGTTDAEDVFLNLGGMFAAVVAIVPTSRGSDYESAVRACEQNAEPLLTQKASTGMKCPDVMALADATRANVQNNMVALLTLGLLGLLATLLFARRDRRPQPGRARTGARLWVTVGFATAAVVWAAGLLTLLTAVKSFIHYAHYVAAFGLLLCILVVAAVNARRHEKNQPPTAAAAPALQTMSAAVARYRYRWIAFAMLTVAVLGIGLLMLDVITLFWLEIAVAFLFALFWFVQTVEQLPQKS